MCGVGEVLNIYLQHRINKKVNSERSAVGHCCFT